MLEGGQAMRVKVTVTSDDIKKGKPRRAEFCPIARALKRTFKTKTVLVGPSSYRFVSRFGPHSGCLSKTALCFVRNFDAEREVRPFSFIVNVPRWKEKNK